MNKFGIKLRSGDILEVATGNNSPVVQDSITFASTGGHNVFSDDWLIPESQWDDIIDQQDGEKPYMSALSPVHYQNGIGMCNASATCSAQESSNLRVGGKLTLLSGGDLYNRICGGRDQGSMLEDGLIEAQNGISDVDECPYLEWRRKSPGLTRKNHVTVEFYVAPTFAHCFSGVARGFDLISGIMWYDSFSRLDSDGWLPRNGGNRGGHAVHGYKPARRKTSRGKEYGIWHKNSHSEEWGMNGLGAFGRDKYDGPVGGWWLVRAVTVKPDNPLPAPVFS